MSKTPRDAERLFAAADPAADLDLSAPLAAVRERLAALPDAPPRRRGAGPRARRRAARAGLVGAIASAIAVATALLPGRDESSPLGAIPLPVQAFADELAGPGILHVVTERTVPLGLGPAVRVPPPRIEGWYALDGSAWRTRRAWTEREYVEQVFDGRRLREYTSACGLMRPGLYAPAARISPLPAAPAPTPVDVNLHPPGTPSPGELLVDLDRQLLHGGVRVLGQTTVGGVPAYEVAYGPGLGPLDWHLFVSADKAALLQIEAPDWPEPLLGTRARSDVPTFEILPATPRNAGLLQPARELRRASCTTGR
jgi:hypothetical protein